MDTDTGGTADPWPTDAPPPRLISSSLGGGASMPRPPSDDELQLADLYLNRLREYIARGDDGETASRLAMAAIDEIRSKHKRGRSTIRVDGSGE